MGRCGNVSPLCVIAGLGPTVCYTFEGAGKFQLYGHAELQPRGPERGYCPREAARLQKFLMGCHLTFSLPSSQIT